MAVNKVIFGGETVIDLTSDTVTADTLAEGVTAHDKTGALITGTMQGGGGGGGVETCTVTVTTDRALLVYGVTKYVDGVLVCESDRGYGKQEITFVDVVKGSCLSVLFLGTSLYEIVATNCTAESFMAFDFDGAVIAFFRVND